MKISKNKRYMMRAEIAALGSHDAETQVGAILVKNSSGAVIADGCNGFVRGAPDDSLPNTRPDKYGYIVHAEANLLANCVKHGISGDDCMLICTMSPCVSCMRLLYQSGITKIIVKEKYRDYEQLKTMTDIKIVEKKTDEGYWELTYLSLLDQQKDG
jgi:dCMP deaminase